MATIASTTFSPAAGGDGHIQSLAGLKTFWQKLFGESFHHYRPELHYMRGPGPAWRAKYGAQAAFRLKPADPFSHR